ncbi:MAG TPA: riboflavin biosynthesis protein RibF [Abditibacteriaceae bacterium]|jgi:riboflavin kinase/FMN adenylyltransferase|nr:riboflavin biosynthesis protein RibF [Abditibacteriaceae bacterium]
MRVLESLPSTPFSQPCALTIGTFDGVHRGHALLIARLREEAARRKLSTAVLTFQDMPYCYFKPDECSRLLTLPREKMAAFEPLQINDLLVVPFDKAIAEQSAEDFTHRVLVEKLNTKLLVVGPDFALGKGRAGDIAALQTLGEKHGFEVVVLRGKLEDEGAISSTRIRECIEDGHMRTGARLSGRTFELSGEVVGGQQLGRTIGVPTINLQVHPRKVLPSNGVYACHAFLDESSTRLRAALNIGNRPTVKGQSLSVEFHVIGENIENTPKIARLQIIERLRDERKFAGLSELVAQMNLDIARADAILRDLSKAEQAL